MHSSIDQNYNTHTHLSTTKKIKYLKSVQFSSYIDYKNFIRQNLKTEKREECQFWGQTHQNNRYFLFEKINLSTPTVNKSTKKEKTCTWWVWSADDYPVHLNNIKEHSKNGKNNRHWLKAKILHTIHNKAHRKGGMRLR